MTLPPWFWKLLEVKTHRSALILYTLLFAALISPFWFKGEVICPHRQSIELAHKDMLPSTSLENRKFSDYTSSYAPETKGFLEEKRSGWVALWSQKNELGRPFFSSFSPVYFPHWVVFFLTDIPERFLTIVSLGMCFLAGFFLLLFLRELGLSPFSALIAGISFASLPCFMYWATFPMFIAPSCWFAGIFYSITFLSRKFNFFIWSLLAFCIYSLLIVAYPQIVVFYFYILTGYGFYLCGKQWKQKGKTSLCRYILVLVSAVLWGLFLSLPVLRDLFINGLDAQRLKEAPENFLIFLPKLTSWPSIREFLLINFWPEILGNPIFQSFPVGYNGESITLYMFFFASLGAIATFRKTWGWSLSILIFFGFVCFPPLYLFCVKYLGACFSMVRPGVPPLSIVVLMAYGVESFMKSTMIKKLPRMLIAFSIFFFLLFSILFVFSVKHKISISWISVFLCFVLLLFLWIQVKKPFPLLLWGGLALCLVFFSFPLLLRQDPANIIKTSPLVEAIDFYLPEKAVYGVASPGLLKDEGAILPPRINQSLGLPSVHTYNSLCPLSYEGLIKDLGGDIRSFWRHNDHINPDYDSAVFWMSNIGLMLSPYPLQHSQLKFATKVSDIYLYQVTSRMGEALQILSSVPPAKKRNITLPDPRKLNTLMPQKILDQGDLLEYKISSPESSLPPSSLFLLSQKFHADWKAKVFTAKGWQKAETVSVNGFFQGGLIPQGTQKVLLRFLPWVRFMWIGHVFWGIVILAFVIQSFFRYARKKIKPKDVYPCLT
ncbi:MAG: hypothetical protein K2P90_04650 [Holosporales bacterium]|nr:hypothetical protein [Holosporales bacterium]